MSFIYKIFCKIGYHARTRLVEVTLGFGPSGKVEKIQCEICKKIYIRRNTSLNLDLQYVIIIIILILLILLFLTIILLSYATMVQPLNCDNTEFIIPQGASLSYVVNKLEEESCTTNGVYLKYMMIVMNKDY